MREIKLQVPDEVFSDLYSAFTAKGVAGSAYGVLDAFMYALLTRMHDGVTEWKVKYKNREKTNEN